MYLWLLLSSKINDVLKVDNDPMHTSELLGAVILGGGGGGADLPTYLLQKKIFY